MSKKTRDSGEPDRTRDQELRPLVYTYIDMRNAEQNTPDGEIHFEAWETIRDLSENDPETCWRLIAIACDEPFSDWDQAYLSAGAFEDLMGAHGDAFIDRVEVFTRRHPKMRHLVATVWKGGMSNAIWDRIVGLRKRLSIEPL